MRCWLGYDIGCASMSEPSNYKHYSNGGVAFRMLRGHCPVHDDGPAKLKPKQQTKEGAGQKKIKGKKDDNNF